MVHGPEGLKQMAPAIIARRDRKGAANYKHETPEYSEMVAMQPFLFLDEESDDQIHNGIRFHRFAGIVYIPSWIHKKTKDDETEVPFHTKPEGKGDMYLRWSGERNIEAAIRSTVHIIDSYLPTGPVHQKAESLLEYIDELGDRFEECLITRDNLDGVVREAKGKLKSAGYLNSPKMNKIDVTKQLLEALAPDSRGRFPNKLVIQTKLASVWVKVRHEQISASKVTDKYEKYFGKLYEERLRERHAVHEVVSAAREVVNQAGKRLFISAVLKLRAAVRKQLGTDRILTAPYRVPSLLFGAGLFGATPEVLRYDGAIQDFEPFIMQLQELQSQGLDWPDFRIFEEKPIDGILKEPSELSPEERATRALERVERYLPALEKSYEQGKNWRQRTNGEILHAV